VVGAFDRFVRLRDRRIQDRISEVTRAKVPNVLTRVGQETFLVFEKTLKKLSRIHFENALQITKTTVFELK
jgi:hypothetical protein